MNLRYFGVHILIQDSGAICLAFLLTAVSTTCSKPLGQPLNDADDYVMEWEGTFDSIWNKTKFWSSDLVAPTEYFPEDEGFIRVYSPQSKAAPRPPSPKTKNPTVPKGDVKATGGTQSKRKLLQLTSDGDFSEHPFNPSRHLLQVDGREESSSSQTKEGHDSNDGVVANDWVDGFGNRDLIEEDEGSGEGSGSTSIDVFWTHSPQIFATEVPPILPLTPNSVRGI